MKYHVVVTRIGNFVLQLLQTQDRLIIFNKTVPYPYQEMVVAHTVSELKEDIVPGDTLLMGGYEYSVTAIGDTALEDLRKNGHVTIVFSGKDSVEQPGQIMVKGKYMPRLMVGDEIIFE
ncbi:PTS glucitol/sorbitol transporter subunit IIA [Mitsuokella multacida]|uniref:PTS glucitol/sorbitol transporter subunit IIA n=1 Tax=Mitsuokella multacida TaxID=52226 RepID=UPI002672CFC9|nr:PTS glucitol/sorbitol transporter subunit IIA [Mitsuokella multacida]